MPFQSFHSSSHFTLVSLVDISACRCFFTFGRASVICFSALARFQWCCFRAFSLPFLFHLYFSSFSRRVISYSRKFSLSDDYFYILHWHIEIDSNSTMCSGGIKRHARMHRHHYNIKFRRQYMILAGISLRLHIFSPSSYLHFFHDLFLDNFAFSLIVLSRCTCINLAPLYQATLIFRLIFASSKHCASLLSFTVFGRFSAITCMRCISPLTFATVPSRSHCIVPRVTWWHLHFAIFKRYFWFRAVGRR